MGPRSTGPLYRARGEDVHTVVAGVSLPNAASLALHERFGFRPVGVFPAVGRKSASSGTSPGSSVHSGSKGRNGRLAESERNVESRVADASHVDDTRMTARNQAAEIVCRRFAESFHDPRARD